MTQKDCQWKKLENHPVTVIELTGDIDSPKKFETPEEIATGTEAQNVALIMENVSYINSSGCGQLVSLHSTIEERGFHLYLVNASPGVAEVFECLGLNNILRMRESLDEVILEVEAEDKNAAHG